MFVSVTVHMGIDIFVVSEVSVGKLYSAYPLKKSVVDFNLNKNKYSMKKNVITEALAFSASAVIIAGMFLTAIIFG